MIDNDNEIIKTANIYIWLIYNIYQIYIYIYIYI